MNSAMDGRQQRDDAKSVRNAAAASYAETFIDIRCDRIYTRGFPGVRIFRNILETYISRSVLKRLFLQNIFLFILSF